MLTYAAWLAIVVVGAAAMTVALRRPASRALAVVVFAAWAAGMGAFLWFVSEPGKRFPDFHDAYYFAGQQIRDDAAGLYSNTDPTAGFTNIPIVAWLFAPFTALPEGSASWVMLGIGIAAVAGACALLIRMTEATGARVYVVAGLFAINGPLYNSLREGNTTHIILLVLVLALWCAERRRDGGLGVLIAVAAIIKPPLALLLLPFVLRQRWKAPAWFAATVAPVAGLSVAIYGFDLHREWYDTTVAPFSRHPVGAFNVQSIDSLLLRLMSGGTHLFNWDPVTSYGAGFNAGRTLIVLALALAAIGVCWRWRGMQGGEPRDDAVDVRLEFCAALIFAIVITPISWSHYYVLLLIPTALAATGAIVLPVGRAWRGALLTCMVLLSLPVITLNPERALIGEINSRVITSHFVIGGLALLGLLLAARWRLAGARVPDAAPVRRAVAAPAH